MKSNAFLYRGRRLVYAALLALPLASCDTGLSEKAGSAGEGLSNWGKETSQNLEKKFGPDVIDPAAKLDRDDYRRVLSPDTPSLRMNKQNEPSIPDVSQLLIDPKAPLVGKDKLITLNVTEDIPLKEVLVELARRADIDIELDPNIRGGIIFRAKDKPFSEVIDRICELTGLRYSVVNGVLKVERDFPYVENYQVDFLNLSRSGTGNVNISTQVLSGGGAGNTSGNPNLTSGSKSNLQTQNESDLWASVESNIKNILAQYGKNSPGIAENVAARTPGNDGLGEILGEVGRTAPAPASGGTAPQPLRTGPAPNANKPTPVVQSESGSASQIVPSGSSLLSINKQAGVISVLANQRQHREIIRFIDKIKRQQSAQVLIEAKVVEVTLDEEHKSGIDWSLGVEKLTGGKVPSFSFGNKYGPDPLQGQENTDANFFTFAIPQQEIFGIRGLDLGGFISFTEKFGVTRTLSSPRINAINNQQAVLTFAKNQVYFEVEIQQNTTTSTTTGGTETLNVSSTPRTVPVGVILTLQPSINLENNEITMNIRPTLTRINGFVEDPAVALQAAKQDVELKSEIPIIEVRELDSILKIKSGQVMVIGGLMQEKLDNSDTGVPHLSKIPFAGNLFKKTGKENSVIETVIFIKATIVPGFGVDPADKKLYRTFTNDPRPLAF